MDDLICLLLLLTGSSSPRELIESLGDAAEKTVRKDTIKPLEQGYHAAGAPFGPAARALLIWIQFQQQTTTN